MKRILRKPIKDVECHMIRFQTALHHLGKITMALPLASRHCKWLRWRSIILVNPTDTQTDYTHPLMIGIVASKRLAKALAHTVQAIRPHRYQVINKARN